MTLDSSRKTYAAFQKWIRLDVEEVWVAALNSQMQLIEKELLFRGTLNQCLVHPREIFRFLLRENAAFFAMAHSHPSGNHRPSRSDEQITRKLLKLADLIQIPLTDHLILSAHGYYSFADHHFFQRTGANRKFTEPLCWTDHVLNLETKTVL